MQFCAYTERITLAWFTHEESITYRKRFTAVLICNVNAMQIRQYRNNTMLILGCISLIESDKVSKKCQLVPVTKVNKRLQIL